MNTKLLIIFMLFLSIILNAQGRRSNQSGIHAEYGYIATSDTIKKGSFMAIAGYNHVFGDKGLLGKVEAFYQDTKVGYTDNQILPYQKYGLNVSAGYSYEGLYPVFLNAYFGAFGAYENVNDGNQKDPKFNAQIPTKVKGFVYGLSGSAEIELVLVRRLSFLVNYTQFYDLKSEFSKSNYAFFGGLKYYIN
ncbi:MULTISPECIES: hypothetical protein [Chryseobacterium]|uniref:Conjugative transposon protein TraO n=1 Tax=Chryseobacterium muglaense TaxID=2893752 RepID=A0ABR8M843_9FLAO|nr:MULTISPECIES: hypothetical protein [Chryseobacterium]MBD3906760.1 hypothetical protein [Chryseobacterium muglaense]